MLCAWIEAGDQNPNPMGSCKGGGSGSNRGKMGLKDFFEEVSSCFVKHIDFNSIHCVVIRSTCSIKDQFQRYLIFEAERMRLRQIVDNKLHIFVVNTTLSDSTTMFLVRDAKAAKDISTLKNIMELLLNDDSGKVSYGTKHVKMRKKYENLVNSIEKSGEKVYILSSSTEQLIWFVGINAILCIPLQKKTVGTQALMNATILHHSRYI
ncbi:PREDICTED: protein PELOTA 2-like [Nelumbo nucifera]|uniref:Protein PELOTA 2-like n=1 Tax=Nelumbo nucifera TaxID=4432 RepID=A0A1U8AP41_NELNU|nr:PREDICTED: protein PELOTA 2-like [Nelumbo nucifera]